MVIVLVCTIVGIFVAVGGFRSRPIACDPACANCGYDLRGYSVMNRCSECGNDLTLSGAVRTTVLRTSGNKIVGGLFVIALPWLGVGLITFLNSLGPHWERLRSNQSLIADIGVERQDPWLWMELTRRLQSGRLGKSEATAAINQLVAPMQSDPDKFRSDFGWASNFFMVADHAGAISTSQYLCIAQACYGKDPSVRLASDIPAETPSQFSIMPSNLFGSLPGTHYAFSIEEISMLGPSAQAQDIVQRPGQGKMLPPNINLMGQHPYSISAPAVPIGKYKVKFVVVTSVVPGAGIGGWPSLGISPAPGSALVAQWTSTIIKPVQLYHAAYSQTLKRPFVIRTDADADPQLAGVLSVKSAEARCYSDVTIINFQLNVGKLPIACWFNGKISVNGHQYQGGNQLYFQDQEFPYAGFSCEMGPLPESARTADLELVPDFSAAKTAMMEQLWGKPITFKDVPLHRRIANFSLKKWEVEQRTRDLKAALAPVLPRTLPSPATSPVR